MDQKIDPLTNNERSWIAAQLEGAALFVDAFSPADAGRPLTLAGLDRAFAAWLATNESDSTMLNKTINVVGVAFGQKLIESTGLDWVIATDSDGSELAVYGLPGQGDVLIYPANFVAKRWERRETGFLEPSHEQMAAQIRQLHAGRRETTKKPWWKFW